MKAFFARPRLTFESTEHRFLLGGLTLTASIVLALPGPVYERVFDLFWRSLIERDLYYHGSYKPCRSVFDEELAVVRLVAPQLKWGR